MKIEPCMWCHLAEGNPGPILQHDGYDYDADKDLFRVVCVCGGAGPHAHTGEAAVAKWNEMCRLVATAKRAARSEP